MDQAVHPTVCSITEVCRLTTLSRPTIERLIAAGDLATTKIGARRLVFASSLQALLEQGVERVNGELPTEDNVTAERVAQGFPPTVTDRAALDAVDAALRADQTAAA